MQSPIAKMPRSASAGALGRTLAAVANGLRKAFGLNTGRIRKVRFQTDAAVYAFERQLFGGGGVPDQDSVSLGLGPKLVDSYKLPLAEKSDKDEYACSGLLDPDEKTELLSEWSNRVTLTHQLLKNTRLLEATRRGRMESASSSRDQRLMPASEQEAVEIGLRDAAIANRVAAKATEASANKPKSSSMANRPPRLGAAASAQPSKKLHGRIAKKAFRRRADS